MIEEPERPAMEAPTGEPTAAGFLHLRVLADTLDDIIRTRIAVSNRVKRAAIEGFAFDGHLTGLNETEAKLRLALRQQFRVAAPAVRRWTLDTVGLGEPLMARLLGATGDPLLAEPYQWQPSPPDDHVCGPSCGTERHLVALDPYLRSPRQFLAYCGWGAPLRRRVGMTASQAAALGNLSVKPLAYVMAEACIKQIGGSSEENPTAEVLAANHPLVDGPAGRRPFSGPDEEPSAEVDSGRPSGGGTVRRRSPYRDVYDLGRERYANRDWTAGHQHQAAVRLTVKAILLDVWRVSAGFEPRWPQQ